MFSNQFAEIFMIANWSDVAEIIIISFGIYRISAWLGQDKTTNLISVFYGYSLLTIACYHASLSTVTMLLCIAAPIALVSFFLIHQKTLQKNFVAFKKNNAKQTPQYDWITQSLRAALPVTHTGKPVYFLIEQTDQLTPFITCQLPVNAPAQHQLLAALFSSTAYQHNTMLWLTTNGVLVGMNTTWAYELETSWFDSELRTLETWKQNALFMSKKTDALFMYLDPTMHTVTIITQGTAYERLSLERALTMLKTQLSIPLVSPEQNEASYVAHSTQRSHSQHTT